MWLSAQARPDRRPDLLHPGTRDRRRGGRGDHGPGHRSTRGFLTSWSRRPARDPQYANLVDDCPGDVETGEIRPVVTIVTDNGGPFRSFRFEAFIELHPELHHVRTRVRTPGQNGSRERGFGTLEHERLFIDEIDDAVMLAKHSRNTASSTTRSGHTRPWPGTGPGRCTWARPTQRFRPFKTRKSCRLLDAGQAVAVVVQRCCIG